MHVVHMKNKDAGYNLSIAVASKLQSPICTQRFLVPKSMPCYSVALMQSDSNCSKRWNPHCLLTGMMLFSLNSAKGMGLRIVQVPVAKLLLVNQVPLPHLLHPGKTMHPRWHLLHNYLWILSASFFFFLIKIFLNLFI